MATNYPVPSEPSMATLIGGLITTEASAARTTLEDPKRDSVGIFSEYVTDDGQLAVLGYADPAMVNCVGGSMMGIEAETVTDAVGKSVLLEDCVEGFREIANVLASCLNTDFTEHLRLSEVTTLPGQLSDDVKQLWRQPRARRCYKITVDDFGDGGLILYLG